ncbi:alanyl-tRNA editing protein [Cohaesibacter gelatinilyticus]|uniref:Misacylated tRNA(Ala) deacylase n=1 Tax=Cohaesibacter gelatinilyticus TaxID=372072 RepID=A0A285NDI3_9HYPH|nr:alanyl-tRNA editing protein [Cohaesibacter gelatinilyticus]SNZ07510.1 misacylated tRNA(Ala) deacylase [Cohaesibacter gelatinilyticus]
MTCEALFRSDSYLTICDAKVTEIREDGAILLDRSIFYPTGGGQPGDCGSLELPNGGKIEIATTRKDRESGDNLHIPAEGQNTDGLKVSDAIVCHLDWSSRYRHMRLHTALHLLSVALPYPVTGGQVGQDEARLDFNIPEPNFTKDDITAKLSEMIEADHGVSESWITDEELDAKPEMVKTMSVQPPRGAGRVRLIQIGDIDLQPCGGTHVSQTAEIGAVEVSKIENKGKQNRRIRIRFSASSDT